MLGLPVESDVYPVRHVDSTFLLPRAPLDLLLWRDRARCDCRCGVCRDCGCGSRCDCCCGACCDCCCGARCDCGCGANCDCGCGADCDCERVGACSRPCLWIYNWVSGTPSYASHLLSRLPGLRIFPGMRLLLYLHVAIYPGPLTSPRHRNLWKDGLAVVMGLLCPALWEATLDLVRFYVSSGLR